MRSNQTKGNHQHRFVSRAMSAAGPLAIHSSTKRSFAQRWKTKL